MINLSETALEWALKHLQRFGDSDILAVPMEYQAIVADWASVKKLLLKTDLRQQEARPLLRFLVPKPEGGYRVATRLDPLDALIYTALVYECVPQLENSRLPRRRKIACSYRLAPKADGTLFEPDSGWEDFYSRSLQLAKRKSNKWVALADISDFYSQINHHRVKNALEIAGVAPERAHVVEILLSNWSSTQSRGLPVGPMVSVPLAEACLDDVDRHLLGKGWKHTRYVDDFRIFCRSREEANEALHDLTEYLYTAHRLALTSSKTGIWSTRDFEARWLEHPAFLERSRRSKKIAELLEELERTTGYIVTEEDLPPGDKAEALRATIAELFQNCLEARPLKMGLARHLLRRAGAIRTNRILSLVLQHLEDLTPVLRDVIVYLTRSKQKKTSAQTVRALVAYALKGEFRFLPLVQDWVLRILINDYVSDAKKEFPKLSKVATEVLGLRCEAQIAFALRRIDWVRSYKETWRSVGPWDRRAIIAAGAVLPADERAHWRKTIVASGDPLDRAMGVHCLL
jgi:hypothetical protein